MANNGKTSGEIANNILDAFDILAKAEVNSAQFDKTVIAIIVSCEDAASGRYRVQYQDSIFIAYSSALDVTYSKGTSVQVRIPNNDFSGRKIIIGTCEEGGIQYGTIIEDPLMRYEMIGGDCVFKSTKEGLCSYWEDNVNHKILYDYNPDTSKENNYIGLDTQMVQDNIKKGNSLILGATIKTDIEMEQRINGNYGIRYTLTFADITNVGATIDRIYTVDTPEMLGQPFAYAAESDQLVPFDVDSKNFLYVKRIELFTEHFPYKDENKEPDIWISNVRFQVANKLSEEELNGTGLYLNVPEGPYFRKEENLDTKTIEATLQIRGKITGNHRKTEYYWFIEDLRVNRTSNINYHKYGGKGWRCLNQYNVIEGTETLVDGKKVVIPEKVEYISADNKLKIKKDETRSRETVYKCVAVYNEMVLDKEIIITNYDTEIIVKINCEGNPNFIDSVGKVTLECLPEEQKEYSWARIDEECNSFESLMSTDSENEIYNKAVEAKKKLLQDWENKARPINDVTKNELQSYENIINSYDRITRLEENKLINIQGASVFERVVYKCQVFDENDKSLGIASQILTNKLRTDEEEQYGNITIKNGTQVFRYDAKGISPTSKQWEEPQVIYPLSFVLTTVTGLEIPLSAIRDDEVEWMVPIKDTMIDKVEGEYTTREEDGQEYRIYNGKSLSYTIKENYNSQKTNNQIKIRVKYQELVYPGETNFLFIKDGEDGTNGTQYVLKIIPRDTNGRLKTVYSGSAAGAWYEAELWSNGQKVFRSINGQSADGNVSLTWSVVGDVRAKHNVNVNASPQWYITSDAYRSDAVDVVKAEVTYKGVTIVATQPIIFAKTYNSANYRVSLKEKTGYTHVTYSEDGLTPDYDSKSPFEMIVQKNFGEEGWGDISDYDSTDYYWFTIGNLKLKSDQPTTQYNYNGGKITVGTGKSYMFEPVGKFNSEENGNAIVCIIYDGTTPVGEFRIPVHFLLNRYGHSAINEWDGNSIQLDADGNTMLLAPQGGFGKKEKDNSYTGLLMGTVKEYYSDGGAPTDHTGIFAYNKGNRTMFLNAETGAANFGQVGSAQIVIDPAGEDRDSKEKHARIYSGDFYKNYDSKTGLPINYETSNENTWHNPNNPDAGKGMLIDLTEPEIRWGNKNFSVDKNGYITAQGGGKIAGWKINDYRIDSIDNGIKPTDTGDTGMSSVYTEDTAGVTQWDVKVPASAGTNKNKAIAFWAGGTGTKGKFHVAHDGYVRMQDATIGSGNENSLIYIGKSGDNSSIYTFGHPTLKTTANGFYIGVDGFSLGSQFKVTKEGTVTIGRGAVDGSNNGRYWTIEAQSRDHSRIYYNKSSRDDANDGVYIGTDGFGLGKSYNYNGTTIPNLKQSLQGTFSKFTVTNAGRLYAQDAILAGTIYSKEGQIAGWHIREKKIETGNGTGEGIEIGSDGHIKSYNDKWKIEKNGTATFKKIRITTDGDDYSNNTVIINANNKFKITAAGKITATSGSIAGWTIDDNTIKGGNVTFNKNGDLTGKNWYIKNDGSTNFGNLTIDAAGNITANGGQFNNITAQGGTFNDITANRGTFNDIIANNGTYNNITTNNMTANNITAASGTIGGCKIEDGVLKVGNTNVTSISASKISGGTLDIKTGGGGYVKAGVQTTHLDTSGINVGDAGITFSGSGGIDLQNKQLGGCSKISNGGKGTEISENVTLSGNKRLTASEVYAGSVLRIQGGLYVGDGDSHGLDWEVQLARGDTMANQGWHKLIFKKGILCGHSSSS